MRGRLLEALRDESGVTLFELVAMMAVLLPIGIALMTTMTTTVKSSSRLQELADLQTEVRAAVEAVAVDLRQAACNGTTAPVTTATGTQITFYSPDRASPYHLRQVAYRLTNDSTWTGRYQLERAFVTSSNTNGPPWTIGSLPSPPWPTVVGSVTNSTAFTYKDADGNTTTTASAVASVAVSLTVAPHPGLSGAPATYKTSIDVRSGVCS